MVDKMIPDMALCISRPCLSDLLPCSLDTIKPTERIRK